MSQILGGDEKAILKCMLLHVPILFLRKNNPKPKALKLSQQNCPITSLASSCVYKLRSDKTKSCPFIGFNKLLNQAKPNEETTMMAFFLFPNKKFQVLYFVFLNPPPPFFEKNVCTELPCSPHVFCFYRKKKRTCDLSFPPSERQVRETPRNCKVHRSLQAARSDFLDTLPALL